MLTLSRSYLLFTTEMLENLLFPLPIFIRLRLLHAKNKDAPQLLRQRHLLFWIGRLGFDEEDQHVGILASRCDSQIEIELVDSARCRFNLRQPIVC